MHDHPRPLLLVDDDGELLAVATRASGTVGSGTVLPLNLTVARQYLRDSASIGRLPAAAILRLRARDQPAAAFVDWIGSQPAPISTMPVLLVTDAAIAEMPERIDVWLERSLQRLLA